MFLKKFYRRVYGVLGRDVIVSIITFLVITHLANILGAEEFGLWISVLTLLSVCDLFFRLKIDSLIVFYSKEYPFNSELYRKISLLSLYALLTGAIVVFALNTIVIEFFSLQGKWFLGLVYANFFLSVFGNITFYVFLSEAKYSTYNISILGQCIVNAFLIVSLFYFLEKSIWLALWAQFGSWVFVLLLYLVHRLTGKSDNKVAMSKSLGLSNKDVLVKGSFLYSSSGVRAMADQLPRLFAINFLSTTFVGYLGVAQIMIGLINRVPLAINTVLYPMLTQEEGSELTITVGIIRAVLLIFFPIIVILELSIPFIVVTFYGEDFRTAAVYVQILLPFAYLGLPGVILSPYFASQGDFKILFVTNISAVVAAVLGLCLIGLIPSEFAPVASICATFLCITISSLAFASKGISLLEFVPRVKDLRRLLRVLGVGRLMG